MANIYESHFEFAGISSRQYDLIIASIDTEQFKRTSGTIESVTVFNKRTKQNYLIDTNYSNSPLSFDIEIVTESARLLDNDELRKIKKWLFNRRNYQKMYFDMADDLNRETYEYIDEKLIRYYLNCRLVNPEKLEYNGGIVGYKATLEVDAGWLKSDSISKTYSIDNDASNTSSSIFKVNIDTDIDDYIYPNVTIEMGSSGGDIIITNNTDDTNRLTKFVDVSASATIIMKGELNYVSGQYYEKFSSRNFIRLLDGENSFTVMGNVKSIKVEYSARRML